jgi:hypothetical protein
MRQKRNFNACVIRPLGAGPSICTIPHPTLRPICMQIGSPSDSLYDFPSDTNLPLSPKLLTHNFFWEASNFGKHSPPGQHGIVQSIRCRIGCVRVDACFSCQAENRISIRFAWNRAENQTGIGCENVRVDGPLLVKARRSLELMNFAKGDAGKVKLITDLSGTKT